MEKQAWKNALKAQWDDSSEGPPPWANAKANRGGDQGPDDDFPDEGDGSGHEGDGEDLTGDGPDLGAPLQTLPGSGSGNSNTGNGNGNNGNGNGRATAPGQQKK